MQPLQRLQVLIETLVIAGELAGERRVVGLFSQLTSSLVVAVQLNVFLRLENRALRAQSMKNSEKVAIFPMSRNTENEQLVWCARIEILWKKMKGGSYYICRY